MEVWIPQREHLDESNVARFMASREFAGLEEFINYTAEGLSSGPCLSGRFCG
jgi:hypothetical protein